jgi:hypothetical protein
MFCGVCGTEFPDDFDFCPKCGRSVRASASTGGTQTVAVAAAPEVEPDTKTEKSAPLAPIKARFDYGTIVFAAFSGISLLVCLAKGIVPIYLGESALWAAVAWYWHKKSPWSETTTSIVLLLAVGVAAGEGYVLGRQSIGNSYTYLTQGDVHYRVNAVSGRTDVLAGTRGWEPVSFNSTPETISPDEARSIILSGGSWKNGTYTAGLICFDVQNNSHYVLQQVEISISLSPEPPDATKNPLAWFLGRVMLKGVYPLDVGKAAQFCGDAPRQFPAGAAWSYGTGIMTGWKR